jgi:homogentisate 1,2-dioxygenase
VFANILQSLQHHITAEEAPICRNARRVLGANTARCRNDLQTKSNSLYSLSTCFQHEPCQHFKANGFRSDPEQRTSFRVKKVPYPENRGRKFDRNRSIMICKRKADCCVASPSVSSTNHINLSRQTDLEAIQNNVQPSE